MQNIAKTILVHTSLKLDMVLQGLWVLRVRQHIKVAGKFMKVHYPEELGSNVSQSDSFSHEGAWNGKTKTGEGGRREGVLECTRHHIAAKHLRSEDGRG